VTVISHFTLLLPLLVLVLHFPPLPPPLHHLFLASSQIVTADWLTDWVCSVTYILPLILSLGAIMPPTISDCFMVG
jgi:hypothetical protein